MELGSWIQRGRTALQWSQQDLAVEVGTDAGSVSRWERGSGVPDVARLAHLCRLFEAGPDESAKALEMAAKAKRAAKRKRSAA